MAILSEHSSLVTTVFPAGLGYQSDITLPSFTRIRDVDSEAEPDVRLCESVMGEIESRFAWMMNPLSSERCQPAQ